MLLASAMLPTLAGGPAAAKPKEIVVVGSKITTPKASMWKWRYNPARVNGTIHQLGPAQGARVGLSYMQNFRK